MTPLATPTSPHFPAYVLAAPPSNVNGMPNGLGGGAMNGMGMAQVLGLGLGPPSALSPGAFWGRAGEGNVYGAPVGQPPHAHPGHQQQQHQQQQQQQQHMQNASPLPPSQQLQQHSPYLGGPYASGGSPGLFGMHALHSGGGGGMGMEEPKGYFDIPPAFGAGFGVEKEIMRDEKASSPREKEKEKSPVREEKEVVEKAETDAGDGESEDQEGDGGQKERPRRHSSDPPPAPTTPLREGRRGPPPPLRLPSTTSTGSG